MQSALDASFAVAAIDGHGHCCLGGEGGAVATHKKSIFNAYARRVACQQQIAALDGNARRLLAHGELLYRGVYLLRRIFGFLQVQGNATETQMVGGGNAVGQCASVVLYVALVEREFCEAVALRAQVYRKVAYLCSAYVCGNGEGVPGQADVHSHVGYLSFVQRD